LFNELCFHGVKLVYGLDLVDAVEPPVYRDGPSVLERLVEVFPEELDSLILGPIQVKRSPDCVQILKKRSIN
jgi:hypothetical protein